MDDLLIYYCLFRVVLGTGGFFILTCQKNLSLTSFDSDSLFLSSLSLPLRDYQEEGVKWIVQRVKNRVGVILADEMVQIEH